MPRTVTILVILGLVGLLIWLGDYAQKPVMMVWMLFSGRMSLGVFQPHYIEGIYRGYFLFTSFMLVSVPWILLLKWAQHRVERVAMTVVVVLTALFYVFPFCFLTVGFVRLLQYMTALGPTPKRLFALLFGLVGYVVLGLVLGWLIRLWRGTPRLPSQQETA